MGTPHEILPKPKILLHQEKKMIVRERITSVHRLRMVVSLCRPSHRTILNMLSPMAIRIREPTSLIRIETLHRDNTGTIGLIKIIIAEAVLSKWPSVNQLQGRGLQ